MDLMIIATMAVSIFLILDPFASVPVFLSVTEGEDHKTIGSYANKAVAVAAILLMVFIFTGPSLMDAFGVTMDGFRVAGGIMLLLMSVELVFDLSSGRKGGKQGAPWVIVATPILTGPGVITEAILLSEEYGILPVVISGIIALAVTWVILRASTGIMRLVGSQAIGIFSRVIGLFIAAMGVEYIFTGTFNWFYAKEAASAIMAMIF